MALVNDDTADPKCVAVLFEFGLSLVNLQLNGLSVLYPRFVTVAMHWINEKSACTQSLLLIRSIAMDVRHGSGDTGNVVIKQNILEQLNEGLKVKVIILFLQYNVKKKGRLTSVDITITERTR